MATKAKQDSQDPQSVQDSPSLQDPNDTQSVQDAPTATPTNWSVIRYEINPQPAAGSADLDLSLRCKSDEFPDVVSDMRQGHREEVTQAIKASPEYVRFQKLQAMKSAKQVELNAQQNRLSELRSSIDAAKAKLGTEVSTTTALSELLELQPTIEHDIASIAREQGLIDEVIETAQQDLKQLVIALTSRLYEQASLRLTQERDDALAELLNQSGALLNKVVLASLSRKRLIQCDPETIMQSLIVE